MGYLLGIYLLIYLWTLPEILNDMNQLLIREKLNFRYLAFFIMSVIYFFLLPIATLITVIEIYQENGNTRNSK